MRLMEAEFEPAPGGDEIFAAQALSHVVKQPEAPLATTTLSEDDITLNVLVQLGYANKAEQAQYDAKQAAASTPQA